MKIIKKKTYNDICGGALETCPGGWEYSKESGYLVTSEHFKCYPRQ